jgi:hypothetical protein
VTTASGWNMPPPIHSRYGGERPIDERHEPDIERRPAAAGEEEGGHRRGDDRYGKVRLLQEEQEVCGRHDRRFLPEQGGPSPGRPFT